MVAPVIYVYNSGRASLHCSFYILEKKASYSRKGVTERGDPIMIIRPDGVLPLGPLRGVPDSVKLVIILGAGPDEVNCHLDDVIDCDDEEGDKRLSALMAKAAVTE